MERRSEKGSDRQSGSLLANMMGPKKKDITARSTKIITLSNVNCEWWRCISPIDTPYSPLLLVLI